MEGVERKCEDAEQLEALWRSAVSREQLDRQQLACGAGGISAPGRGMTQARSQRSARVVLTPAKAKSSEATSRKWTRETKRA